MTKFSHLHEQIQFVIVFLVCMGLVWVVQLHTKASQLVNIYTKLLESIELHINPSVVCARLYINEFASVMI